MLVDFLSTIKDLRDRSTYPRYNSILVIIYRLIKEAKFIPYRKDILSKQFVYVFIKYIFAKYRILEDIIIDRVALFILAF